MKLGRRRSRCTGLEVGIAGSEAGFSVIADQMVSSVLT